MASFIRNTKNGLSSRRSSKKQSRMSAKKGSGRRDFDM